MDGVSLFDMHLAKAIKIPAEVPKRGLLSIFCAHSLWETASGKYPIMELLKLFKAVDSVSCLANNQRLHVVHPRAT